MAFGLRRVTDLCVARDVPVYFADGEPREIASTWGRFMLNILGSVAELEANVASDRAVDALEARRVRGDHIGPRPFGDLPGEDLAAVLGAYEERGSAHGAAVLLNERGVPTRRGRPWTHGTVRNILVRAGRMPAFGKPGAKPRAPFPLYRLLR